MKIAKKSLSLFLSLLMIFTACSVGFTGLDFTAYAATGSLQSVKNALTDYVVEQIVYHGSVEHNAYTYKGDVEVVLAADEIYAYAMSLREGNGVTNLRNSTAGLLAAVAANTGFTSGDKYTALKYILDPTGDVVTAIESDAAKNKSGTCDGCDHSAAYPTIPTDKLGNTSKKTVKVYASVASLLEKYNDVNSIPASLLQGVEYDYAMRTDQAVLDENEHKDGCDTVYDCVAYRWNYFSSLKRTEIKNIISINELKEFGKVLASEDLSMTFDEMIALPASELEAIYNENYAPYQAMIDKYTFDVVKDLYGSYNDYFADLLKAMQINLSLPAIDILMDKVGTAYDSANYDEMAAIYAPTNSAYSAIKGYGSEVFDYIATKAEYADFDIAAAKDYLDDMKKAMDLITLPGLKTTIDADLAAYDGVNLNTLDIPVLKTLLNKLNGYKGTINAANANAVSAVMASTVNKLDNLIAAVKANLDTRAPSAVEEAFNVQYNYYTPLLFGNYGDMATADVMAMYSDYQKNLDALKLAYDEQVEKYGASVVNPLFSVTIGEGGSPTLIQNAVTSIGTTAMKTELTARNSAQLAIAAGYKDMAANVNFDNLVVVGTAVKNFDKALYQLCADNSWVSAADQALYSDVSAVITAYTNFVNKVNSEGFKKVELDKDGVYVVRDVYNEDLVKEEAYTVDEAKINSTIVKLDNFLASEDFGALLGFEDAQGNALGLGDYLYGMIGEMLFNNDLINMVVGMLFPMIEDLLVSELGALLNSEDVNPNGIPPLDPGAIGYVDLSSLVDGLNGGIDVYLGDVTKEGQERIQMNFATLLKSAGLYIFPATLADSMVSSGVLTTSSETYKLLKEAGNSWTPLGIFDPETETFTYDLNLDWGITDRASFTKALGGVLDSVGSLLPTLFLNTAFDKTLGDKNNPAGVGYGSISGFVIVNIQNAEFYATLSLAVQSLNLYANLFQPLFGLLGVTANANLTTSSKGIDYAKAILDPIFSLLDKVVAAPLDTILGLLPNLAYILSTDFIDTFLGSIVLDFSVKLGIADSNGDGLATLLQYLGGLLNFEVFGDQMGIADIAGAATLKDLVGIDISNLNNLLDFLFESLGVALDLPDIDQTGLIECAKWNSKNSLTADKADVLFFLLDYLVSALNPDFLNAIIGLVGGEGGGLDLEGTLGTVLNTVMGNISNNHDDVIAALVELFNPVEYELEEMTWATAPSAEIVYLKYANDWTKSESQYLIDNAMDIVATVLGMTGSEVTDINAFLKENVDGLLGGLFTNETITKLVETFAGIELPEILSDILVDQLGVNMGAWANDFGYLFNEELEAPDATVLGVTAVKDEEGNIVWNGLADGDKEVFVDTLCAVLAPLAPAVAFLLGGKDLGVFGIVELKGYESFDSTLGALLETLGVAVPAVDFATAPMTALNDVVDAVFTWLDATLASDALVETAINLVTNLIRYIESNGLSVLLHNLLLPVLALVDTVRPLINVDVNTILSVIVSDLVAGNELDMDKVLGLVLGTYEGNDDITVTVTIDNLTLTDVLGIVDAMFGSDLVHSSFATIGLKGLCDEDVDAADALTIILSSLIDALGQPAADKTKTNADAIFGFVAEKTGNDQIGNIVNAVLELIGGVVYEYDQPDWDKIFTIEFNAENAAPDLYLTVDAKPSIAYLEYTKDWTVEAAQGVYSALDEILELVLPSLLGENETIAALINGMLEENVYSDEILNTLVETVVNLLAGLDAKLFEVADVVLDTDIATWFTFCTLNEETGEYECTKDWGVVDAETFVAALKEALAPANQILAFLFFGDSYEFFTDSEVDANGNYTYKSLITLNGGEGYAKGLVPIFEALGLTMKPASAYLVNGKYDAVGAVADILNAALGLIDELATAESTVAKVFELLPNLIYFINVDGIKASVNNILSPVNAILEKVAAISEDIPASITDLIPEGTLPFDITNITTDALLAIAGDAGFTLSDDMIDIIKKLYVGELVKFESASGDYAYKLNVEGYEHDVLTIVLSIALDAFKLNEALFAGLLPEGAYDAVMNLLNAYTGTIVYQDLDWGYMYADKNLPADGKLPARVEGDIFSNYTKYQNNWNEDVATVLDEGLEALVDGVMALVMGADADLGKMLEDAIVNGLYTDSILNSLIEMAVGFLVDYEEIIKGAGAVIGAEGLAAWFDDYCDIADDGTVTCEYDWGIDAAETAEAKRAAFVSAFATVIEPANRLLAWLLFGEDFEFFTGADNEVIIKIKGGEGYNEALVPLLEAFGVEAKPVSEFVDADGNLDMTKAVTSIFDELTKRIAYICNGVNEDNTSVTVTEAFDLLPNLIYFINAGGLKVVVNNLLAPVQLILTALEPLGVSIDFATLIEGIDITNLDLTAVFPILEEQLGIVIPENLQEFLATFYIGKLEAFESANGETAYRMVYTDEETRIDFITVIISLVADVFTSEANAAKVKEMIGDDVYTVLMRYLANNGKISIDVMPYDWVDTDKADTGEVISPVETEDALYSYVYGDLYTREQAEYMNKWLPEFVDTTITLIGVQGANGENLESLDAVLKDLVGSSIYTTDLLNTLANALGGLVEQLKGLLGDDLFDQAAAVLNASLGVDVTVLDNYQVTEIATGDRNAFVAQLVDMLSPVNPILKWLFTDEDLAFFSNINGGDYVVIEGADGYANGIIPLLEALGCEGVLTPEEYAADEDGLLLNIINPLLNKVDEILSDPVNKLLETLPGLIYFINSNGINAVINNALRAVLTVLANLDPLVDVDLYELVGVESADLGTFDSLIDMLLGLVTEGTGLELKAVAMNAVNELTMGTIVSFTSKNGETAYTMKLATGADEVDFVTTVLRLVLNFVSIPENVEALEVLLADSLSEEGYTFLTSLLENFSQMAATEDGMDAILYTVYQIFYTANVAVHETEDFMGELNDDYTFLGNLFATSDLDFIKNIGASLGGLLDNFENGDIIGSEGVAQNGLMKFFQAIKDFFQKIADFFKNLFS